MSRFELVKQGKCPDGHGKLDDESRCDRCSANWIITTPPGYQSTGYGRNTIMAAYHVDDSRWFMKDMSRGVMYYEGK